jgi:hypothetical protein
MLAGLQRVGLCREAIAIDASLQPPRSLLFFRLSLRSACCTEFSLEINHDIARQALTYLGSDELKRILENLARMLALAGLMLGALVAYFLFVRDLKFSTLKKLISDDHDGRKSFGRDLVAYKSELLRDMYSESQAQLVVNPEFLDRNIDRWKEIFQKSQTLNSEIANVVHLMYHSLLISRYHISQAQQGRINFVSDFHDYYIGTVELLLSLSQKMRLFPTVMQSLFPYGQDSIFSREVDKFSQNRGLKTDAIADIGVNTSGLRKELIAYTSLLMRIRNPLLLYDLARRYDLSRYACILLLLKDKYFIHSFEVKYSFGISIMYSIFNFKVESDLLSQSKTAKLYYAPSHGGFRPSADQFFESLTRSNQCFELRDILTGWKKRIPVGGVSFSMIGDNHMIIFKFAQKDIKAGRLARRIIKSKLA